MPTITTYYGITDPVPFIDVDVSADNRLFVDPHAIRLRGGPQPFADQAVECLDSFTDEVTASVFSPAPATRSRGKQLLQRFIEPWETRLGMSSSGFRGHGGADDVGDWIWEALTGNIEALVHVGILKHVEDLPLFVEGIDRDITSDITTRLIFDPLARFTEEMLANYPQFTASGHGTVDCHRQVWSPVIRDWTDVKMTLPIANGEPLMLVPQGWARRNLLMNSRRYYETSVLSYAQMEQAVRMSDGKLLTMAKDLLKKQPELARGRSTNTRVTLRALDNDADLLATFKAFVASKLTKPVGEGDTAA
ncbi:hypothetical protein [Brevibacterium linens]|uniref:hypothetical protein n=1 Tax=Brevibacterium linens TaxID=1703 RepID=UPI003BF5EFAE